MVCHYWKDPETGKRHFIPGCWGRMHGEGAAFCTCPKPERRRKIMKHLEPIQDYANVVNRLHAVMEERDRLRCEVKELKANIRELVEEKLTVQIDGMANRESVDAKLVESFEEADAHGPGSFIWQVGQDGFRHFLFMLPGEDFMRAIPVTKGDITPGVWKWNGDERNPTLTPSILAWDPAGNGHQIEYWHGYLTNGRFVSV